MKLVTIKLNHKNTVGVLPFTEKPPLSIYTIARYIKCGSNLNKLFTVKRSINEDDRYEGYVTIKLKSVSIDHPLGNIHISLDAITTRVIKHVPQNTLNQKLCCLFKYGITRQVCYTPDIISELRPVVELFGNSFFGNSLFPLYTDNEYKCIAPATKIIPIEGSFYMSMINKDLAITIVNKYAAFKIHNASIFIGCVNFELQHPKLKLIKTINTRVWSFYDFSLDFKYSNVSLYRYIS